MDKYFFYYLFIYLFVCLFVCLFIYLLTQVAVAPEDIPSNLAEAEKLLSDHKGIKEDIRSVLRSGGNRNPE